MYRLITILNARALRRLFRKLWRYYGSEPKAARVLGITQPHFHRLCAGGVGARVRQQLVDRLWKVVQQERADLVPLVQAAFESNDWQRYYAAHLNRYHTRAMAYFIRHTREHHALRAKLTELGYGSFLTAFLRKVPTQAFSAAQLGLYRALEPLVAGELTGGMAPTVQDLDAAGTLRAWLRASFERERILAEVTADAERARRLYAQKDPRFLAVPAAELATTTVRSRTGKSRRPRPFDS
jgi:hypothetical protein